jgi:hypothetical protein
MLLFTVGMNSEAGEFYLQILTALKSQKLSDPSTNWNGCKFHISFPGPGGYQFFAAG